MRLRIAVLFVAVLVAAGCGKKGDMAEGQVPVKGKVTGKDGKGVGPVALGFFPTETGRSNGTAVSAADGTFTAKTSATVDGLIPGKYKVTASSAKQGGPSVPSKYGDEATTDLIVEVSSGKDLTIELK